MQQSLASLTDAVLRHKTNCSTTHHSIEEVRTPIQQSIHRDRESQPGLESSSIPIAPIQAVRNMNSWITGQRPDGKQEQPNSSTTTSEAAVDEKYISV
jgi:hypothetical protein